MKGLGKNKQHLAFLAFLNSILDPNKTVLPEATLQHITFTQGTTQHISVQSTKVRSLPLASGKPTKNHQSHFPPVEAESSCPGWKVLTLPRGFETD